MADTASFSPTVMARARGVDELGLAMQHSRIQDELVTSAEYAAASRVCELTPQPHIYVCTGSRKDHIAMHSVTHYGAWDVVVVGEDNTVTTTAAEDGERLLPETVAVVDALDAPADPLLRLAALYASVNRVYAQQQMPVFIFVPADMRVPQVLTNVAIGVHTFLVGEVPAVLIDTDTFAAEVIDLTQVV